MLQLALPTPAAVSYLICFYSYILSYHVVLVPFDINVNELIALIKLNCIIFDIAFDIILGIKPKFYLRLDFLAVFFTIFHNWQHVLNVALALYVYRDSNK